MGSFTRVLKWLCIIALCAGGFHILVWREAKPVWININVCDSKGNCTTCYKNEGREACVSKFTQAVGEKCVTKGECDKIRYAFWHTVRATINPTRKAELIEALEKTKVDGLQIQIHKKIAGRYDIFTDIPRLTDKFIRSVVPRSNLLNFVLRYAKENLPPKEPVHIVIEFGNLEDTLFVHFRIHSINEVLRNENPFLT